MRASSALRIAVDPIESLNFASVRLKASSALFIVGLSVGAGAAALQPGCSRRDHTEHSPAEKLASPDAWFVPIAHQKRSVGQPTPRYTVGRDALEQRSRKHRIS